MIVFDNMSQEIELGHNAAEAQLALAEIELETHSAHLQIRTRLLGLLLLVQVILVFWLVLLMPSASRDGSARTLGAVSGFVSQCGKNWEIFLAGAVVGAVVFERVQALQGPLRRLAALQRERAQLVSLTEQIQP